MGNFTDRQTNTIRTYTYDILSKIETVQYEKPCSGYPNKEKTTYKPFVVPQKDTEHYFQAFKSYNIPELFRKSVSFSAVKIRQVHEKVPAEPLNDSLVSYDNYHGTL